MTNDLELDMTRSSADQGAIGHRSQQGILTVDNLSSYQDSRRPEAEEENHASAVPCCLLAGSCGDRLQ
jgi:hypothetical protein